MPRHRIAAVLVTALALTLGATACGGQKPAPSATSTLLADCRNQWHDVAETVVGLDEDTNPSALATRWNSVVATIDYYENTTTEKDCQTNIETQVKANSLLRSFSEKLRPYDMAYQLTRVSAAADLYVHDPLPSASRNENNGKLIKPPAKAAVATALATLTTDAVTANTELQPAWDQLASVELTDEAAVTAALGDLDSLAQDSPAWGRCEQALQVLVAAITAQEGALGSTS